MEMRSAACHICRMGKKPKRPRDPNQLAKFVIDAATGDKETPAASPSNRKHIGGMKGGKARAKVLTIEQRSEIARAASQARWKKS